MVVSAATYTVGASGANYTCIQDALDNSSDGDTIEVWNGTHVPPGPQNVYKVNNSVDIVGNSSESTIINLSVDAANGFYIYSDYVNISNINFTDADVGEGYASGVASEYNFTNISNCVFYSCANGVSLASDAFPATNAIVANNTFIGSLIDDYDNQNPISLVSVYYANITNNTIIGNFTPQTRDADAAIYIDGVSQNNIIKDNIIRNFTEAINIDRQTETAPTDNTFTGNILIDNTLGINISTANADDNIFYDNYFNNIADWVINTASSNTWNTSKTSDTNVLGGSNIGGNFWSGYTNTTYDNDSDGIGDTPYTLFGAELDNLPLLFTGPQNITASVVNHDDINISWDMGFNCDNVIVVRKEGSYPTSRTDGTEVANTTNTYHEEEIVFNTYYALWGYNTEVEDYTAVSYLTFYALRINVYNESDTTTGLTFDLIMSNTTGTQTYEGANNATPTYLDMTDIPTGDDISLQISATGYSPRLIYIDLDSSTWANLTMYLAHNANLYYIQVIDERDEAISDVKVTIKRYINSTVGYEDMDIRYTDDAGYVNVYLIPDTLYKINLSKSGYQDKDEDYTPDPTYFGIYYPKIFRMIYFQPDVEIIDISIINFTGELDSSGFINITYEDGISHTTNTEIQIFEIYNNTRTHNNTDTRTGDNQFTWTTSGYNIYRNHIAVLWLNHTDFTDLPVILEIFIPRHRNQTSLTTIEDRFVDVFGDFELGWTRTFIIFLPCLFFLIVFGAAHTGLGIMSAGLYLGFITYFIDDINTTAAILPIALVLALVGALLIIARKGVKHI